MNRNIVTEADVHAFIRETAEAGAGSTPPARTPDQWYEQLIKYIPAEALSLYLGLDGVIRSADMTASMRQIWLALALIVSMIFAYVYLERVWNVSRKLQIAISTFALVAYVFALGGVFNTFSFYAPWQGTIVLIVVTAFLALFPPPGPSKSP